MKSDRVVVTGRGTVNAIAKNVEAFAGALKAGVCGIGPVTLFDTTGCRTHTGAQVRDFDPRRHIPEKYALKRMSRSDCMAMAATLEALSEAGLTPFPEKLATDTGVVIGGGAGGCPLPGKRCRPASRLCVCVLFLCLIGGPHCHPFETLGSKNHIHDRLLVRGHGHWLCC
jgi:3-oxoacyl-(acyl-carrier-protein) synthase